MDAPTQFNPSSMSNDEIVSALKSSQQQTQSPPPSQFDASKLSDAQIQQALGAKQVPQPQGSSDTPQNFSNGPAAAVVAGIGNGTASMLESVQDSGFWLAHKLGLSDQKYQDLKDAAHQTTNVFRSSADGDQTDPFNKAVSKSPNLAKTAETLTDVGYISSTPMMKSTILNAAINAVVGAGIGTGNEDSSALLSAGGTFLAKPLEIALGTGIKAATAVGNLVMNYLKPVIDHVASDDSLSVGEKALKAEAVNTKTLLGIKDSLYEPIKSIPGTINQKPLNQSLSNIGKMSTLDAGTAGIVQEAAQKASTMTNMEDALNLKQFLSENTPYFKGGVRSSINSVITDIKAAINSKAVEAGLGEQLTKADNFYSNQIDPLIQSRSLQRLQLVNKNIAQAQYLASDASEAGAQQITSSKYAAAAKNMLPNTLSPEQLLSVQQRLGDEGAQIVQDHLVQSALGDLIANPENADLNKLLINVNKTANKYSTVLTDATKQTFQGIQILLKEAGAVAKDVPKSSAANFISAHPYIVGSALGGIGMGGYGAAQGDGVVGSAEDAVKGLLLGAGIVKGGNFSAGLLQTTKGQTLLRYIAAHPEVAHGVVNNVVQLPAQIMNTTKGN